MAYKEKEIETLFNKILLEIEGGKAIRNILSSKDMPDSTTFYIWLDRDADKSKRYARACEARADAMVEDMLEIADNGINDTTTDEDGNTRTNQDVIQRSKLRVETRKWLASKLKPKKYGDSSLVKFADNEGDKLKVNAIFNIDLLNVPDNNSDK